MFYNFIKIEEFDPLFRTLEKCRGVEQMEEHHPEGDVFIHSLQVLKWAFRESNDIDLIIAAMLHDVGKQIGSRGHEQYAVKMLKGFISPKTAWLIENHMRFWYFILGDMKKLSKVKELGSHVWFKDLAILARWDKLGRKKNQQIDYDRIEILDRLKNVGRLKV